MNSEKMKVWIIEKGNYSDYHVVGIYSTKENAERVATFLNHQDEFSADCSVRERTLDPGIDVLNEGLSLYRILMLRDGEVEKIYERESISTYTFEDQRKGIWRRRAAPAYKLQNVPDCLDIEVFAKDKEHAIKIANEHRTMLIATNQWSKEK